MRTYLNIVKSHNVFMLKFLKKRKKHSENIIIISEKSYINTDQNECQIIKVTAKREEAYYTHL